MKAELSRTILFISIAIAVGLPGLYAACLGAGFDPVGGVVAAITGERRDEVRGKAPPAPEPPKSVLFDTFERGDGARNSFYESELPPEKMAEAMKGIMLEQGWNLDETWTRELNAERDGHTLFFRARGWQCDIFINELRGGSDVTIIMQPASSVVKTGGVD